jgi:plastocyanin
VGTPGVWGDDSTHLNTWSGGVAIDKTGHIVVADTGNNRLKLFTANGAIYSTFGQYGQGQYQFNCPASIAVNPTNGDIAVADQCNQRIQVYTKDYLYKATLGTTNVSGSDNTHFNNPWMIANDSTGRIYIADSDNHRVQRCTISGSSGTCSTFAGVTNEQGSDFSHFSHPFAIAIDDNGRVYVSDEWNNRVLVFDANGAFVNNIAGSWGAFNGQLRSPEGIAVDHSGNVYVTDYTNHRVQKYTRGLPGWRQSNITGFGTSANTGMPALASFNGSLYAGVGNSGSGAQLWQTSDGLTWTPVMTNGFGNINNVAINHMAAFNGNLYAGTWANATAGGEIWRSGNGLNWTRVVSQGFGDPSNGRVFHLIVFSDTLYASTWSYTSTHGAEIWRSADGLNWTRTISNGFGTPDTKDIPALTAFNGQLYAGTYNYHWTSEPYTYTGGAVWRTADGNTWEKVSTDGFGLPYNYEVSALAVFNGSLYAALANDTPSASIYRCQVCNGTDWVKVEESGFPSWSEALYVNGSWLYWAIPEPDRGETVFRSANGTDWERIADMGFGTYNDSYSNWSNSLASFNDHLYVGSGSAFGGQIWKHTVTASFASSTTSIKPGKSVTFTNTSAGDYITSTWNFGDGNTLTQTQNTPLVVSNITPTVNHIYTASGVYTVTLTVNDGIDKSTFTSTSTIQVGYRAFLPIVMCNYDVSIALYDDFNDTSFNGFYNPLKWYFSGPIQYFSATQQSGSLVLNNTAGTPAHDGLDMWLIQPPSRSLQQIKEFEAKLKVSSGNYNTVKIQILSEAINGHGWWTECSLQSSNNMSCDIYTYNGSTYTEEYGTNAAISTNTWYIVRMEINPITAEIRYYLNNVLIGNHTPNDATSLLAATNFVPRVGTWNDISGVTGTRYIDDVKITPANQ